MSSLRPLTVMWPWRDHLPGLRRGWWRSRAGDDVVQPPLQDRQQRVAGVARSAAGQLEVPAELPLEDAVVALDLLLLAEADAVLGRLAAAELVHARRALAALDGALGRVAARPLEEQLHALAAAEPADRSDVACHGRQWSSSGQSSVSPSAVTASSRRGHLPSRRPMAVATGSIDQTRRFFGGRQPLCGSGVTSSIALIVRPAACRAVMADSRPEPGPLTLTSTSLTPNFVAVAGGRLGGPLGGERRALAAALEADGAGRGPAQRVAVGVGDGDDRVVERRLDVGDAPADVASCLASSWLLATGPVLPGRSFDGRNRREWLMPTAWRSAMRARHRGWIGPGLRSDTGDRPRRLGLSAFP